MCSSDLELHLLVKGMGYDVRAHSSADTLAKDQRAAHALWLIINVGHDMGIIAALSALRKSGWFGRIAIIADEKAQGLQHFATLGPNVSVLPQLPTAHRLHQLLGS